MEKKKLIKENRKEIINDTAWKDVSRYFQWSEQMLDKYKTKVDWEEISQNFSIIWTPAMLEKFKEFINWKMLSGTVCWSILTGDCFEQFKDYWDWAILSGNTYIHLDYALIDRFIDQWDWAKLINRSTNDDLYCRPPVTDSKELYDIDFLERYADRIPADKLQDSELWRAIIEQRAMELKLEIIK